MGRVERKPPQKKSLNKEHFSAFEPSVKPPSDGNFCKGLLAHRLNNNIEKTEELELVGYDSVTGATDGEL